MYLDTLFCVWILVFPIDIIEVSTKWIWCFLLYFSSLRFLTTKYLKLFSTFLVGRNGVMWKTCFSAPQNAKKNQLKHKNQVHNRHFIDSLREWMIILGITSWGHNSQTFILISKKILSIWKLFVYTYPGM